MTIYILYLNIVSLSDRNVKVNEIGQVGIRETVLMNNNKHYVINDNSSLTVQENKGEVTRGKRINKNVFINMGLSSLPPPQAFPLKSFLLLGN